jgi:hypothetical protein
MTESSDSASKQSSAPPTAFHGAEEQQIDSRETLLSYYSMLLLLFCSERLGLALVQVHDAVYMCSVRAVWAVVSVDFSAGYHRAVQMRWCSVVCLAARPGLQHICAVGHVLMLQHAATHGRTQQHRSPYVFTCLQETVAE